jgi:BirA family biotin operon repressor/biotin-[acetyl-CoA-carboxylase] ligase
VSRTAPTDDIRRIEALEFIERCHFYEQTDSTSSRAAAECPAAPSGIHVFWALRQSAGRGRHGRSFFSAIDGGLWVSLGIPLVDMAHHFDVNRALSLAVCRSVESLTAGAPLAVKWPNDIFWGQRKLCGILLESRSSTPPLIVAGFGLNVNIPRYRFPAPLRSIATSLSSETNTTYRLSPLLLRILTEYHAILALDRTSAHEEYVARLYGVGRHVAAGDAEGVLETVEPDGRLVLRDGHSRYRLLSGTVRFLD